MSLIEAILRKMYRYIRPGLISELKQNGLVVGKNFRMHDEVIIDFSHCWHITIGDDVTLAPRVYILAHDASTYKSLGYTKIGKVTIGNHVFIGAGSIILPGVQIGSNVVIGAGSVVAHDIPDNSVAAGNPAKVISSLDGFITCKKNEMTKYPCFENEYTLRGNITKERMREMNEKMRERFGFVR
jgi:maltose O-acetyltransferase